VPLIATSFERATKVNGHLLLLDLRGNQLDDEAGHALAAYLGRRTKIGTLLISDNGLEAPSAKAIAKAWAENSTLAYLDVRGNKLDADAVKALKAARGAAAKKNTGTAAVELLVDEDP